VPSRAREARDRGVLRRLASGKNLTLDAVASSLKPVETLAS
jgi:hypothetical protein